MSALVTTAIGIARVAHAGVLDKQGLPYVDHCRRVAARMTTEYEQTAAWLHDVVEDSERTCDDLLGDGIPMDVVVAVAALTHGRNEPRADYYKRVMGNGIAHRVKLADIADNTDPRRLLGLPVLTMARLMQKYGDALDVLQGPICCGLGESD